MKLEYFFPEVEVKLKTSRDLQFSFQVVAARHDLNWKSLRVMYYRKNPSKEEHNRKYLLTEEEEKALLFVLQAFSLEKFDLLPRDIRLMIMRKWNVEVSADWVDDYLKRYSKALNKTSLKRLTEKRSSEFTIEDIEFFIQRHSELLEDMNITAKNLVNYDETRIGPAKGDKTFLKRVKAKYTGRNNVRSTMNQILTSMIPFVTAEGKVICIFYIIKGNFNKNGNASVGFEFAKVKWKRDYGFREFVCYTETGFVNKPLFEKILLKFEELWHQDNPGLKCLLLGDNCSTHLDVDTMLDMYLKGVHMAFFAPLTTHFSQPLDSTIFALLKPLVYALLEQKVFNLQLLRKSTKRTTVAEAQEAAIQTLTKGIIKDAFEKTGIWPWNPEKLLTLAQEQLGKWQ